MRGIRSMNMQEFFQMPGRINIIGQLDPAEAGIHYFSTVLEYQHFPPQTETNGKLLVALTDWADIRWIIISVEKQHRSLLDRLTAEQQMMLSKGVPKVTVDGQLYRFPAGHKNAFTLHPAGNHPVRQPGANRHAWLAKERYRSGLVVDCWQRRN